MHACTTLPTNLPPSPVVGGLTLRSRTCILTQRNAGDAAFMRQLWADPVFMRAFHRLAPPLPPDDRELQRVLQAECNNPIAKTRALHWVVRSPDRQPWGLLSLTDVSLQHKRAEVLIGVLPNAPFALASAAMLMLFHFYFREKKFNKLYSLVFADNHHSLKSTLHLGFRQEGLLKGHIYDAASQGYVDLIQTGLLAQDAFSASNLRLMQKLLAH